MSDFVARLDSAGTDLATVKRRFADFAAAYAHLPLYRAITASAALDDGVAAILTAAEAGQARPVLFLAALHDLVLEDPSVPAARWYPSVGGRAPGPDEDPWPEVRATIIDHAARLRTVVAGRATQTNEVNRAVYVATLVAMAAAAVPDRPVALLELGASAGLLLGIDRYRVELVPGSALASSLESDSGSTVGAAGEVGSPLTVERVLGDPDSPVRCAGEVRSVSDALRSDSGLAPVRPDGGAVGPGWVLPEVVARLGLDRSPVNLDDEAEVRWLEACLWPDQPERLDRFRAAVTVMRRDPPTMVAGDMVDDLEEVAGQAIAAVDGPVHLVVLSSWALTYVERTRRPEVAAALGRVAAEFRQPVSWITAEPPGAVPGLPQVAVPGGVDTVLGLRRWPPGTQDLAGSAAVASSSGALAPGLAAVVGFAHPHGTWVAV